MHGRPTCREGGRHESIITGFGCILLFYYYQLTKIVPTYVYTYTCGHNGMIKFVCGHNGTADTTGRTSCSVLSACGQNGTIKFVCGHNGTADTTGRNRCIYISIDVVISYLIEVFICYTLKYKGACSLSLILSLQFSQSLFLQIIYHSPFNLS